MPPPTLIFSIHSIARAMFFFVAGTSFFSQGRGRSVSGPRYYDEEEAARFLARMAKQHGGNAVKIDK